MGNSIDLSNIYVMALIIGYTSQVSDVGPTHSSPNIKNIMLKIRNYYTAIVKALEQVPHVS